MLAIIPSLKINGSPVRFLRDVTPPTVRIARCGECGRHPSDPVAGIACRKDCPIRHNGSFT